MEFNNYCQYNIETKKVYIDKIIEYTNKINLVSETFSTTNFENIILEYENIYTTIINANASEKIKEQNFENIDYIFYMQMYTAIYFSHKTYNFNYLEELLKYKKCKRITLNVIIYFMYILCKYHPDNFRYIKKYNNIFCECLYSLLDVKKHYEQFTLFIDEYKKKNVDILDYRIEIEDGFLVKYIEPTFRISFHELFPYAYNIYDDMFKKYGTDFSILFLENNGAYYYNYNSGNLVQIDKSNCNNIIVTKFNTSYKNEYGLTIIHENIPYLFYPSSIMNMKHWLAEYRKEFPNHKYISLNGEKYEEDINTLNSYNGDYNFPITAKLIKFLHYYSPTILNITDYNIIWTYLFLEIFLKVGSISNIFENPIKIYRFLFFKYHNYNDLYKLFEYYVIYLLSKYEISKNDFSIKKCEYIQDQNFYEDFKNFSNFKYNDITNINSPNIIDKSTQSSSENLLIYEHEYNSENIDENTLNIYKYNQTISLYSDCINYIFNTHENFLNKKMLKNKIEKLSINIDITQNKYDIYISILSKLKKYNDKYFYSKLYNKFTENRVRRYILNEINEINSRDDYYDEYIQQIYELIKHYFDNLKNKYKSTNINKNSTKNKNSKKSKKSTKSKYHKNTSKNNTNVLKNDNIFELKLLVDFIKIYDKLVNINENDIITKSYNFFSIFYEIDYIYENLKENKIFISICNKILSNYFYNARNSVQIISNVIFYYMNDLKYNFNFNTGNDLLTKLVFENVEFNFFKRHFKLYNKTEEVEQQKIYDNLQLKIDKKSLIVSSEYPYNIKLDPQYSFNFYDCDLKLTNYDIGYKYFPENNLQEHKPFANLCNLYGVSCDYSLVIDKNITIYTNDENLFENESYDENLDSILYTTFTDNIFNNICKKDLKINNDVIIIYCRVISKTDSSTAHATVLIYIDGEIYHFFPNGKSDFIMYIDNINLINNFFRKLKIPYNLIKRKEVSLQQGPQSMATELKFNKMYKNKYMLPYYMGTCEKWALLFVEIFLKALKLVDNRNPLIVHYYLLKIYDNPLKINKLIAEYILYFNNIQNLKKYNEKCDDLFIKIFESVLDTYTYTVQQ